MPTPFDSLFDPDKQGTISGFIGQAMGNPSQSQYQGQATGEAQQQIAQMMQSGMSQQQALVKFIGTPQGIQYFTAAGPDGMKQLQEFLTASTPPDPKAVGLKPGETGVISQGGKVLSGDKPLSVPTTEQQNFNYFGNLSQVPPARLKELAEAQIDPAAKNNGVKERSIDKLVADYGLDPQTGEKLKAGLVQVVQAKDQFGASTGDITLLDISDPQNVKSVLIKPVAPGAKGPNAPVSGPGVTPEVGGGTGVLPAAKGPSDPTQNKNYFGDKASMFLGAGVVPNILGAASKLSEQVDPSLIIGEGAKANDRSTQIAGVRNSLLAMEQGQGSGWGLNKATLKTYLDLVPTDGVTESPHASIQKGIRLLQRVQQEETAEEGIIANQDPNVSQAVRADASKRLAGWKSVERTLPTMDEMSKMEESIRNGTAGAPTIASGAKAIVDQAGKVLTSGKKQATEISSAVSGEDYSSMEVAALSKVDPRKLTREQQIQYRNRIQQLKAARGTQ